MAIIITIIIVSSTPFRTIHCHSRISTPHATTTEHRPFISIAVLALFPLPVVPLSFLCSCSRCRSRMMMISNDDDVAVVAAPVVDVCFSFLSVTKKLGGPGCFAVMVGHLEDVGNESLCVAFTRSHPGFAAACRRYLLRLHRLGQVRKIHHQRSRRHRDHQ